MDIDWLAQHPVSRALEHAGGRVHPASRWLANESAHIESESAEHDLHAFQALRRMDDHADVTPDHLAEVVATEIGKHTAYHPVAPDGAARAATLLAELL
ncbi:hypothetical protein [Dactylosporangium sp. NPDC049140]|uniref:hypothetical protein n=1 Tax=Dactylosporangium sp. NPDC049140 TaxID=3155647 RepID=UPI0033E20282